MRMIDLIIAYNKEFVAQKGYEKPHKVRACRGWCVGSRIPILINEANGQHLT